MSGSGVGALTRASPAVGTEDADSVGAARLEQASDALTALSATGAS